MAEQNNQRNTEQFSENNHQQLQHGKLILAILQDDDYEETISVLNQNGFFVTTLSSTGGFLKKKSTTVMIGTDETHLQSVLDILKATAGHRRETVYRNPSLFTAQRYPVGMAAVPVEEEAGGVTVFVMELSHIAKF